MRKIKEMMINKSLEVIVIITLIIVCLILLYTFAESSGLAIKHMFFQPVIKPIGKGGSNSCGTLTNSITLTGDLFSQGTCFTVAAENIVIDCQGHSITGTHIASQPYCSGYNCSQYNHNSKECISSIRSCRWNTFPDPNPTTTYGIYSDDFNHIEIKNCKITNFTTGIYLKNTYNSIIRENILLYNTDQGIKLTNPRQNTILGNTISNNGFRFFFDWSNLTFPLPVDFDGIYINYKLEPIKKIASTEVNNPQYSVTGNAASQTLSILPVSCTDTDGGWNLQVRGTCTDSNHSYNDSCFMQGSTTFLKENYCMNGFCQSTPYNCAALGSQCIDGACVKGNETNKENIANLPANNIISNNNLTENSLSGIVIDEGINNNIIEHNNAYLNYENRGNGIVVYSDYNEIRNNNATFNMIAGIAAYTSSHNKIHDNYAYHNNYTGILIEYSSHYNEIYNNYIEYNGCEGVYINRRVMGGEDTGSTYNRIYNNRIINNTLENLACLRHIGVLVDISPYTYVYNNYIANHEFEISPDMSNHQYYFNNTIIGFEPILFQSGGSDSLISFNRIVGSQGYCVYIVPVYVEASNITISDNDMFCGEGLDVAVLVWVDGLSFIRNNITCIEQNRGVFIYSEGGAFNFENNIILCGSIPVQIGGILNNNTYHIINSTYNKRISEYYSYYINPCDHPIASREWYLKVFVRDRNGRPVDNAVIQLISSTGFIYNSRADVNGTTPLLILPEYQRDLNWTEDCRDFNVITNWFSPYTITISKQGYRISTMQLDLNQSKYIAIMLDKIIPPLSGS